MLENKAKSSGKILFYPYYSFGNLSHIDNLLMDTGYETEALLSVNGVNDIGGADGDLAFYCESIGARNVSLIDNAPTNFNNLSGARFLKEKLSSGVEIIDTDLDSTRGWEQIIPVETTIFLGILYHLQNPFFALSQLSKKSKYLLISTKVFDIIRGFDATPFPMAYFYSPGECNNDITNWWCMTDECLKRMIDRAGWNIISYKRVGCVQGAEPNSMEKDGRAFAFLKTKN